MNLSHKKDIKETTWLSDMFSPEEYLEIDILSRISTVVQRRRKQLGLTQAELARKIDVRQSMISRWENGEDSITSASLAKLAIGLDLKLRNPLYDPQVEFKKNNNTKIASEFVDNKSKLHFKSEELLGEQGVA